MNFIQIAGHLGVEPETRFTPNGQKVTTLRMATNSKKNGKEETIWWRVTIWGDRFDKFLSYVKKGSALIIIGELGKPEIYTDKEGNPQVSLNITAEMIKFSPFGKPGDKQPGEEQSQGNAPLAAAAQYSYGASSQQKTADSSFDDDLPF